MSRHLVARFRRAGAGADDGWRNVALPHTRRSIKHFNRHHGGPNSLPVEEPQFHTRLVNHGETRYGLEVMNSADGWLEWSIHRQDGPDINDPDHWERMETPKGVHPFCGCIGETDEEHDLNFPLGEEEGFAGLTNGGADDEEGIQLAKADVERAFKDYTDGLGHGLGGDGYDINQIMRDEGFR